MSEERNFRFDVPVELTKGQEDEWRIKGIASTPDQDLQGESVDQEGLDISALKAGRGLFNWDHQKGPENVLGIIEDANFKKMNGKKVLEVDGYLFKDNERAKGFYSIMKGLKKGSSPRVHMSIEGKILKRDLMNEKNIKKARIDRVALTLDPVNPHTYASLVKSLNEENKEAQEASIEPESEESSSEETINITKSELHDIVDYAIQKARNLHFERGEYKENPKPDLIQGANQKKKLEMTDSQKIADDMKAYLESLQADIVKALETLDKTLAAGAPSGAPEGRSGGEALQRESLEKDPKLVNQKENKKKTKKSLIKSVLDSLKEAHPNEDPWELTEMALQVLMEKNSKESQRE